MTRLKNDCPSSRLSILIDEGALSGLGRAIFLKAAEQVTAADVNAMATHGRGIVSAGMRPERAYALRLYPMGEANPDRQASAYLTSVESVRCSETGISAAERALTLNTLGSLQSTSEDLVTPGHIMPAVVSPNASGGLELVSLALDYELRHSGSEVIAWCDILDDRGDVASSAYAAKVAMDLGCPLLVRRATAIVDAEALASSKGLPELPVMNRGLDLGQFA